MPKPVNKNVVDLVASMLTNDPDILVESAPVVNEMGRHRRTHTGGGKGQYEAEEVPLDPSGTLGSVIYDYEVHVSGRWYPATWGSPAEGPEVEIGKITNMDVVGYDEEGNEIQPTPEQLEIWKKSAIDYFDSKLADTILNREYEKLANGDYDYEPDEDDYRRDDY